MNIILRPDEENNRTKVLLRHDNGNESELNAMSLKIEVDAKENKTTVHMEFPGVHWVQADCVADNINMHRPIFRSQG